MEDLENDDFDIEPAVIASAPEAVEPPSFLLSSDKVQAVRFHQAKPGYVFTQVETFVDQVMKTLDYLEKQIHASQVTIHEKQEEIYDLQETISTLKATIEVFRANGDPLRSADGSFVTESQLVDPTEFEALRADRDRLAAELVQAREDADRGWEAETELRRYVEETLQPWVDAVQAQHAAAAASAPQTISEPVAPLQVDLQPAQEPFITTPEQHSPDVEHAETQVEPQAEAPSEVPVEPQAEAPSEVPVEVQADVQEAPEQPGEDEAYLARLQQAITALEGGADASMLAENLMSDNDAPESAVETYTDAEAIIDDTDLQSPALPEEADDDFDPAELEEQLIAEARGPIPAESPEVTPAAVPATSPFAVAAEPMSGEFQEDVAAPAAVPVEEPAKKSRKTKSHLASSPEVAALGGEAVIHEAGADSEADVQAAPQAGAPIPRLLASAPEVLAAGLPVDPEVDDEAF
jgi:DivIVA domain-containing protein